MWGAEPPANWCWPGLLGRILGRVRLLVVLVLRVLVVLDREPLAGLLLVGLDRRVVVDVEPHDPVLPLPLELLHVPAGAHALHVLLEVVARRRLGAAEVPEGRDELLR